MPVAGTMQTNVSVSYICFTKNLGEELVSPVSVSLNSPPIHQNMKIRCLLVAFCFFTANLNCLAEKMSPTELQQSLKQLQQNKRDTGEAELLIRLAYHYVTKPGELKTDMDSATTLLNRAEGLSKSLHYAKGLVGVYVRRAALLRELKEPDKAKAFCDSAILQASQQKLYYLLGEAYLVRTGFYEWLHEDERAKKNEAYEKALQAFRQSKNIEREAFCLKNLADLNMVSANFPLSASQARQALQLYESIGYKELQGVYDLLNIAYSQMSDYTTAVKYGIMAVKVAESVHDTSMQLCTIYNRLGISIYRSKTSNKAALENSLKAFAIAEKYKEIPSLYSIAPNAILCYLYDRQFKEALQLANRLTKTYPVPDDPMYAIVQNDMYLIIYNSMKDWPNAGRYARKIMELYKEEGVDKQYARAHVIEYFLGVRDFKSAQKSLEFTDELFKVPKINAVRYLQNRQNWFKLDSARGNYTSAINYLLQYNHVKDSVFDASKSKIIETVRLEYETDKKDKDIQLKAASISLLTQQTELQQVELQRSRLLRNLVLIAVAALLIIVALVYRQFRQKKIANGLISEKNEALERLVEEKEWLVKEIHHRVKNNLQTIVSLLESQSAYLQDDALLALQDSQNRVYAMSLIHQKLYQSDNVASIKMSSYLPELVNYLKDSFDVRNIQIKISVSDIELDVSQAVPIGLILNEAITNAIKYAFPNHSPAQWVKVLMETAADGKMLLAISDNGVGLPPELDVSKADGLGLRLMKGLAGDIDGEFTIESKDGTIISVSFMPNDILAPAT